jgi:hypothetical protein
MALGMEIRHKERGTRHLDVCEFLFMRDISFHNKNNCSIAGISKYIIRDILNRMLATTKSVVATVERPYYKIELSINSISNILGNIEELKIADNLFSVSFIYDVIEDNSKFIETFIDIWFEYEQPCFCFFVSKQSSEVCKHWFDDKNRFRYYVNEIVDKSPCYVIYKGIEEDVMWIEKSKTLEFNGIIDV